jgi:molecular chaperone DnaK (HSP70)
MLFDFSEIAQRSPVHAFGIDLGTTNSTVAEARWDPAQPDLIEIICREVDQPTLQGRYTHYIVPSVVALHQGSVVVGEGAKRLRTQLVEHGLAERRTLFAETKNEIGTARTYPGAPEGFGTPADIAGHVLGFVTKAMGVNADRRIVVTVPASFQAAQRNDTRLAAQKAGLAVPQLLDEPLAAFLDYANTEGGAAHIGAEPSRLLVCDFGGGTCDVAILEVALSGGRVSVGPLAVSRYHRLGGGDIDAAILHDVLIPELCRQNGIKATTLGYATKRNVIAPAFAGIAEALKIGLCEQIERLIRFGKFDGADKAAIVKTQPGTYTVTVEGRALALQSPSLSAAQFETLLEPFLDTDLLFARSTEYRRTCSIFAPIVDGLDRAGLSADDIDLVLLVGGSARIPQLAPAIRGYFANAELLSFKDRDGAQTAIARGAALAALYEAMTGKGFFSPTAPDRVALRTADGAMELVPKGAALPYPQDRRGTLRLGAPRSSEKDDVEVRVEVIAGEGDNERLLLSTLWPLTAPVTAGEPLDLSYSLDGDQVLDINLVRAELGRSTPFAGRIENPLTNVVNPNAEEQRISELEMMMQRPGIDAKTRNRTADDLVAVLEDAGHLERAIEFTRVRLTRAAVSERPWLINRLALLYQKLGDTDQSARLFREAASLSPDKSSLFNLALQLKNASEFSEALDVIRDALSAERDPPYGILEALLLSRLGDNDGKQAALDRHLPRFAAMATLNDWQLGWYETGARLAGDTAKADAAAKLRRKRAQGDAKSQGGELPIMTDQRA